MTTGKNPTVPHIWAFVLVAVAIVAVGAFAVLRTAPAQTTQTTMSMNCGSSMPMMHMTPVSNEYEFLRDMIPHHQEAVDTAKLTLETTENPELRKLLTTIVSVQEQEIDNMNDWLDSWYTNKSKQSFYHPMMGDLTKVSGTDRDVQFLKGMIMHHEMAVQMATQVLSKETHPEVHTFALAVVEAQTREIGQMREMLKAYGDKGSTMGCCSGSSCGGAAMPAGTHMMPDGTMMRN